jgi:hypothetical protein
MKTCNEVRKIPAHLDVSFSLSHLPESLLMVRSAPTNLRLAQKHYHARVVELRELILAEEMKFK